MINVGIPSSMWPEIVLIIVKVINRTAIRILARMIPYKAFMDQIYLEKKGQYKPKVSYLRVLGCKTYI